MTMTDPTTITDAAILDELERDLPAGWSAIPLEAVAEPEPPAPVVRAYPETGPLTFTASDFLAAWTAVSLAASKDGTRPVLNALHVECADDGYSVRIVATDSYRLHLADISTREPMPADWRGRVVDLLPVNLPALKQLLRRELAMTLEVSDDGRNYTIGTATRTGSMTGEVQTLGEFPNYRQLIPMARGAGCEPAGPNGVLSAFNPSYLAAVGTACKAFTTDDATPVRLVHMVDGLKPALWQVVVQDRGTLEVLLMPVRVS